MFRSASAFLISTVAVTILGSNVNAVTIQNPSFETVLDSGSAAYVLPTGAYPDGLTNANVIDLSSGNTVGNGVSVPGGWTAFNDASGIYDHEHADQQLTITNETG